MKRHFKHPEPQAGDLTGPRYWKSLDELAETPAFQDWLHREFPEGASELNGVNRRQFMKIMAASFGLAGVGLSGCSMPKRHILPYAKQPERMVPGVPLFYASSFPTARDNQPLIVETHEARPTKIEGNPSYQTYGGSTNIFAQASVLDLYDNDRLQKSSGKSSSITQAKVKDLLAQIHSDYKAKGGAGLAFVANQSTSPTRSRLVKQLKKALPKAIWSEYEPVDYDKAERALNDLLGKRVRPVYHFDKAARILSVEHDFLHNQPGSIATQKRFAKSRRVKDSHEADKMNRLYAAESYFSLTGAMADHRKRVSASYQPAFVALFAAEVLSLTGAPKELVEFLRTKALGSSVDETTKKWVHECAKDLVEHKGKSVFSVGAHLPEEIHALAYLVNDALGANGTLIEYLEVTDEFAAPIQDVAKAIEAGKVSTLIVLNGNPVYDAPADLNWATLQEKVDQVIHYTYAPNETTDSASYAIAANHYLESWGDGRTYDGTYVPVQPMILPLFEGMDEVEFIARLAGLDAVDSFALVHETFNQLSGKSTQTALDSWLAIGVLENSGFKTFAPKAATAASIQKLLEGSDYTPPKLSFDNLECRILPSNNTFDGRYSNNGWMQEVPDPMTKLTWDNAICVSPKLAKHLNILPSPSGMNKSGQLRPNANSFSRGKEQAPMAKLKVGDATIEGPVHTLPGLPDHTVVVYLGYGRKAVGRVGEGTGFDVYPIRTTAQPDYAAGAKLELTGANYLLANTQEHWSMEGRAIIREASVEDYKKHPDFVDKMGMESHSPAIYGNSKDKPLSYKVTQQPRGGSAYETPTFSKPKPNVPVWNTEEGKENFPEIQQWGMSIDLNTCTGCNACVVACQSENNVPIVGKDQVLRGREMHWIRLDRYFSSGAPFDKDGGTELPEDPQVSFMGMACQHCELAPCESVCPVNATVHDEQGLNVMAYNRCVGTRYCANNCPYKVRRFNFFDWNKREPGEFYLGPLGTNRYKTPQGELHKMQRNPDVTVRMRGVMEKCTYCVQRIEGAKIAQKAKAKNSDDIKVRDGVIKVACQQVCPTEAIVFGDVADETTEVYKTKESDRDYSVLGYLNVRPRTTYLAKLRNPNPLMPGHNGSPLSTQEYDSRYGGGSHSGGGDSHGEHAKAASHGEPEAHAKPAEGAHH